MKSPLARLRRRSDPAISDESHGPRVIVVSTDPLFREEALYGFPSDVEVVVADDTKQALKLMGEWTPVAVVVDIQTGNAGGFSLARDMSQIVSAKDVPILMLLERPQDEWLARQAGAEQISVKPIETGELVGRVLALIPTPA